MMLLLLALIRGYVDQRINRDCAIFSIFILCDKIFDAYIILDNKVTEYNNNL